MLLLT